MNHNINPEELDLEDVMRILDILDSATYRLIPRIDTMLENDEQRQRYLQYMELNDHVNDAWRTSMRMVRQLQERLDTRSMVD